MIGRVAGRVGATRLPRAGVTRLFRSPPGSGYENRRADFSREDQTTGMTLIEGRSAWVGRDVRPEDYRVELSAACHDDPTRGRRAAGISATDDRVAPRGSHDAGLPRADGSLFPSAINHSGLARPPFSATERFITNTRNATAKVNTATIQKQSK
jgi:hypothetical protein